MDNFINSLVAGDFGSVVLAAAVVAGLVFGIVELADRIASKDGAKEGLTPNQKFYSAIVLSFIIPVSAYVYQALVLNKSHIVLDGLFLACAVAYVASQSIHWATGGGNTATAMHQASMNPDTPMPIQGSNVAVTVTKTQ